MRLRVYIYRGECCSEENNYDLGPRVEQELCGISAKFLRFGAQIPKNNAL